MPVNNISLTGPIDPYRVQLQDIERRRALAEALQQQSLSGSDGQTQSVNGWAIPNSPLQGVAKLAQALAGAYGQKRATEREAALGTQYQSDLSSTLSRALQAGSGTPENAPIEGQPGPVRPAMAPDQSKMAQILMEHPGTQAIGQQQIMADMNRKALVAALQSGNQSQATPAQGQTSAAPGGAAGPAGGQQTGQSAVGGPAGGVPLAAWLQADPTGKSYMEQLAKENMQSTAPINVRPGGAVFQQGKGVLFNQPQVGPGVQLNYGPGGPTASPVPGAAPAMAAQAGAVAGGTAAGQMPFSMQQMEVPVYLPGGDQINVKMNATQAHQYQTTGQLPHEIAASIPGMQQPAQQAPAGAQTGQLPAGVPAADAPAFNYVANKDRRGMPASANMQGPGGALQTNVVIPGPAVVGRTQSQTEQIKQEGQKAANVAAGADFIKKQADNYDKLRDVPATLENMGRAKALAASKAQDFMGPFGQSKLEITKFIRSNVPGMGNISTEGVTNAEELQSTLFNQVMDNLKKMDASPSQYQQQVMQEAFGTLRTDPKSVPKILDVFSDILRNRVAIHNDTVTSAEARGTTFPYDIKVKLPEGGMQGAPQAGGAAPRVRKYNPATGKIE